MTGIRQGYFRDSTLVTIHHSPFTIHYSLFTIHYLVAGKSALDPK